ncbi:MAG: hypothetical protein JO242_12775 [Streptosporangiaceae bacterium]|nr:hypothetical protein [Streptosporangiaceae bacterium]
MPGPHARPGGRPRVLVCGDVVNDVLVEPLAPLTGGEDNPAVIRARPGGSAANQAAWMANLGLDVVFAGRAGAGDVDFHRRELSRFGVLPLLAADPSAATGSIVVLTGPDGDRTMITDRGANLRLTAADVPASLLDGAALLHLTGYSFFEPGPREAALALLTEARARGVPFTIDPGSAAFLARLEPGAFLSWTRGAAVCFPNRDEAAVLTGASTPAAVSDPATAGTPATTGTPAAAVTQAGAGGPPHAGVVGPAEAAEAAHPPPAPDSAAMARRLTAHYGAVVVKLGAAGAVLATAGSPPVTIPARPAGVRDTTGAGDAFCAAFLATWLGTGDLYAAAASGAETAAVAVSVPGGRPQGLLSVLLFGWPNIFALNHGGRAWLSPAAVTRRGAQLQGDRRGGVTRRQRPYAGVRQQPS